MSRPPLSLDRLTPDQRRLFELRRRQRGISAAPLARISRRAPGSGPAECSSGQRRFWFLEQLDDGAGTYNVGTAVRLRGRCDRERLEASLGLVVERHEALRTTFHLLDGRLVQNIHPRLAPEISAVDLSGLEDPESAARAAAVAEARRPFDLTRGPLLRLALFRLADREHLALLTLHHIVSDGWSLGVLVRELALAYGAAEGRPADLPELPLQYADFAHWQRTQLATGAFDGQLAAGRRRLAGAPTLELPTDRPRDGTAGGGGGPGGTVELPFGGPVELLHEVAQGEGATLFMALLAAFSFLLARLAGQREVVVGTPVVGRGPAETHGLIGLFVNTLALRLDLAGDSGLRQLIGRAREAALAAFADQDLPFERLVEELAPDRQLGRSPVFQAMIMVPDAPMPRVELPGLVLELDDFDSGAVQFELTLIFEEGKAGQRRPRLALAYRSDLFDRATAERWGGHLVRWIAAAVAAPDVSAAELDLFSPAERQQLLREWNDSGVAEDGLLLHQLFETQAARRPEAVALVHPGGELSYGTLDRRASELAAVLCGLGIGPEARVAVCLDRSPELLVALLAVWKAGGAYLPLDPALPRERRRMLLADAGAALLVTRRALAEEQLDAETIDAVLLDEPLPSLSSLASPPAGPPVLFPDSLAWVMYTSGSTGTPNGVLVPHRGAVPLLRYLAGLFGMTPKSRVLQVTAVGFDVSLMEIFLALANGGSLCQVTEEERLSPGALAERLEQRGVTTVVCTPAFLDLLPASRLPGVAVVGVGGEACPAALAERWTRGRRLVNCYGPTEATIYATFEVLESGSARFDRPPAIGRPSPGMEAHVLDGGLLPVPPGAPGELALGGIGLARGYLDRPQRTAERFVPHAFAAAPGERLYRTGDLVRRLTDGRLEFLGRIDHQVKIRGVRIELGEIEAVLRTHPAVLTAAVLAPLRASSSAPTSAGSERRLLAWVVPRPGEEASPAELRRFLAERLPAAMVPIAPAHIVALDALPVTATGKLDRKALERRAAEIGTEERERTAPRTPAERLVARLWQEVLELPEVGIDDNFFALGGSSIQAAILTNRLEQELGERVWVVALFDAPTIERLTAYLLATCPAGMARATGVARASGMGAAAADPAGHAAAPSPERIPRRPPGAGPVELSSGQQRFWFLEQLDGGAGTYHIAAAVGLRGRLDPARLAAGLAAVAARHETLRTTFHLLDGRLVQRIHPHLAPEVGLVDLSGAPAALTASAAAWVHRPFDLARGPLLRLALLRLADQEHLALLTLHHIVADGWSLGVLVRELALAYEAGGGPADLPELPIQYADFAHWQRARLAAGELDGQLAEWRRELAEAPVLELPSDRPRELAEERGAAPGGTVELPFGGLAAIGELAQAEGATLFMALLAALSCLLGRLAGQREVVVGTPVAGRGGAETHGLVGLFVNTLALRLDLAGDPSPRRLVRRAREVTLAAFSRQDLPFDRLVEELAPERQAGRSPVFQAMLTAQNTPLPRVELPGLVLEPRDLDAGTVQVDLHLTFEEHGLGGRSRAVLQYRRDLFDRATAERWGGHLVRWIAAALAAPDASAAELDLFSPAERHQLLREWNDSRVAEDGLFLHQLFEAQAARRPEAVALVYPGGELSYGTLDRRASELAAVLCGLGIGPEARVAVCLDRSPELLVALLAVWKAGGAYLPLDPALPRERRRMLLADAGAVLLVTRRALAEEMLDAETIDTVLLDEPLPAPAPLPSPPAGPPALSPDSLAWVMYTSGSTGTPNGVLVPHRGAVPLLRYLAGLFGMTPESRVLQVIAVGFDVSLMEIFLALANGGSLCQVTEEERLSPGALAERLEQRGVTTVVCTPAFLDLLPASRLPGVAVVGVGGEASPAALAERWARGRRLINCYGPTEATIYAAFEVMDGGLARADRPPAIGRPSPGMEAHVLDGGLLPVPPGAPGELALGGIGLARGYLDRPHRTAERFVPHPFAGAPGERLYRTGDLVRRLPDGRLEFLGRIDHQVKIRGVRIELGEIEAVLRTHPAVLTAAVLAPSSGAERRLLAWVVPRPGQEASPAELRRFLAERLPAAMVPTAPAHIVALDALPVTATGKLDRRALERQAAEIGIEERERTPPRTSAERLVARLWQEVLKLPEVGVDDDFFALGGSSIQAAILTNRLEEELGERVWVVALFDAPTVERLTDYLLATCPVGMARATGVRAAAAAASPAGETVKPPLPLRRRAHAGPPPLSFAQERLWFLDRLEPGSPAYVIPATVRLHGVLDVAALAASLAEVVRRHAVLRTRFGLAGGRPVQIVDDPLPDTPAALPLIDLAGLGARAAAEAGRLATAAAVRPFDLAEGPPLRAALVRLGREEHAVLVALHHIAGDAWSIGVLVAEMAALYPAFAARRPSPLPELPVQYADFAVWQREQLAGEELARQLAWWRQRLAGAPLVLELPADRPRPVVQSFRGAAVATVLPPALAAGLAALGARGGTGTTPFMTLLAGFQALLGRVTGQPALLVGSTIANRTRRELEPMLGFFVNTLVLRADLAAQERFAVHLGRVRADTLGAYVHQDLPFELLVEELRPPRDLSRAPLVQVIFQMQNAPAAALEVPGLRLEPMAVQAQTAKFDLVVSVSEEGGGMSVVWSYSTDLFDRATVARLAGHFTTLLTGAAADPGRRLGDLPLLAAGERHQLLVECNPGARPGPGARGVSELLHGRFAEVAAARAQEVAVVWGDERWSYGELAARARRLAWLLVGAGVKPGDRVGLFLDRSVELVAAVLAVVETGAAYVPVDPGYPAERVAFVLADSGVTAVVSQRHLEARLPGLPEGGEIVWVERGLEGVAPRSAEPLPGVRAVPGSPAYVIYTSGSTGRPKGVEVSHAQVARLFDSTREWFGFGPDDVWTLFHSIAFDFSVWELWGPLLSGGRLVVVPHEVSRSPEAFYELLARQGVTVLNQTPSAFRQLIWAEESVRGRDAAGEVPALRLREVIFGGEALEPASLAPWVARHGDGRDGGGPRLVNMYGITETTVHVTWRLLSAAEIGGGVGSVIGVPIPDLAVYLVDRALQPVPLGVPGEILVGGAGLALGYLGRPDLTAERFVPDPFSHERGARLYRSGDLARRRPPYPDKDLEYLGRIDTQVKIRGFRIELGEIESALAALPGVREAAVLVREESGEKRLVAYLAGEEGELPDIAAVRALLAATLPDYMLPSALVHLPALPLTVHGKIDRQALPAPGAAPAAGRVAPRTALERELAGLFSEVLGGAVGIGANVDGAELDDANLDVGAELASARVGVDDDFFALGGSSISGAVLINRLQQRLGEIVHVVAIFDAPTVARLAAYLGTQHREAVLRIWGPESLGSTSLDASADGGQAAAARIDEAAVERLRGLIPAHTWSVPEIKNPRAIFVLSPPRSGSTLLRVMLAGHPALFAPPELELLGFQTLAERSAAFGSARDSFWLEGAVRAVMAARGYGAEEAREELAAAEREGLTTLQLYGRLQSWLGERTLVDKTPSYALSREVLERAEAGFEEPFYIHLVRHPLGMIQSFEEARLDQIFLRQAADQPHGFSRRELAELIWVVSQENIRGFLAGVPAGRRHELRFEELVRDPEGTLAVLCAALGLEYEPTMARPYEEGPGATMAGSAGFQPAASQVLKKSRQDAGAPSKERGLRAPARAEKGNGGRMTDGLHAASRMLGDVKFHQHRGIDAAAAERWRESRRVEELGEVTARLARSLGYAIAREGAVPAPDTAVRIPVGGWRPGEPVALSFAQERLWFIDQLEPGSPAYTITSAVRISGALSVPALAGSLAAVVRRHAALRTRFSLSEIGEKGERPVQIVDAAGRADLPLVDLAALPEPCVAAEVRRLAGAAALASFDLGRGPLLRALLLRTAADEHVALLNLHHIVGDGWSMSVLTGELGAFYRSAVTGEASALPELPVQYPDFALWQRGRLSGAELERQVAWWRERLAGVPTVLDLPADRPRPVVLSRRGADLRAELPAGLGAVLGQVARRAGATSFMALFAGFTALVGRITGRSTLVVGSTIANRTRRELEDLIGFFVNTLALRADLVGEEGFAAHLRRVREATLAAWTHQDLPFEKLVEELRPPRDPSRAPLVQVLCQMQNVPAAAVELPGVRLAPLLDEGQSAKFDLVVNLAEHEGRFAAVWRYSTDLFDRPTIVRLAGHFATLLEAAAQDPEARLEELPLLAPAERHQLLVECNPGPGPEVEARGVPELLHGRFAKVAAAREEEGAVVCGDESWSYGELAARARGLAWLLVGAGVKPGDRVGLFLDRSPELVVAVLAVVECGAVYVPVDPGYPMERVAFVLADSGVRAVVSQRHLEAGLPGLPDGVEIVWVERMGEGVVPRSAEPLAGVRAVPGSPAYVIYTSGSTGRPKGVEVSHAQVARLFDATAEWFGFGPDDVWTLFHSIAFDFSVWELWGPLLTGGRLVVVPYEVSRSPEAFYELLAREGVTVLNQTPSAFRQLIWAEASVRGRDAGSEVPALRLREVIFGGEALEPASLAPWVARHGDGLDGDGPRLVNMYGITETTVHVTWRPLTAAEIRGGVGSVIGVPIPDLAVYLVDRALQPVPLGVPGEILVGGAGLALGYLGRPDLTADRFVPDPFSHERGARLYRSGDLARRRPPYPDKDLEYIGRIDHQIKIRGFRIELGEIEAALARHPAVREAVVTLRAEGGEKRLVAYVTGEEAELPDLAAARTLLAASLPDYMLPSALLHLPALPLTAHGKVDRRALPAPGAAPAAGRVTPRTALERDLAGLFAEVLRTGAVGLDDDFFELGGNSISGAVLINRLQREVGEIVHVVAIFDASTVRRLAAYLETEYREAVRRRWGARGLGYDIDPEPRAGDPAALRIGPGTWVPGTSAPLSFAQERLWFLDRLEPGSPAYHLTSALRLTGALDVAALGAAVAGVVRRHAALRTTFPVEGDGPVQRVADAASVADWRWPVVDLAALPAAPREAETGALAQAEARRPFDLAAGPLLRTLLLRLGPREHAAVVVQHHIVSDGWSMGVFVRELVALYTAAVAGVPARLPELPLQYPDFAIWQRRYLDGPALDGPVLERQLGWWRSRLAGAPPELELPFDRPRASSGRAAGRRRPFPPVPGPLAAALAGLGRRHGASLFMTLLAGFSALLARVSNQPDVVVGSPIAGRNRAEIEGLIGFFVNTLALRADLGGDPGFGRLLGQVRETVLGAFEHQDLPFEKLVADLAPERNLNATPLFQVMFALQNAAVQIEGQDAGEALAAPGLAVSALAADAGSAKFDIILGLHEILEGIGGIGGAWSYRTDLFDGATVERLGRHLLALLEAVAADPDRALGEIPLLTAAERQALAVEWNDPVGQDPRTGFVHRLVAVQAAARPAAPAVVDGATGAVQTYGELAARAARLAQRLNELGAGPERPVGVYLDRCLELPAVLLGVLASGGVYLPLDPTYPAERLAFLLADAARGCGYADPPLVVTRAGLLDEAAAVLREARVEVIDPLLDAVGGPAGDLLAAAGGLDPENAAYAIYTSGSTGTPKGAVVSHRSLANRMLYHAGTLRADDSFLHKAAIGFDVSLYEILAPLAAGGRTVLLPPGGGQDNAAILRVVGERRVTHVSFSPTALAVLLDEPGLGAAFRAVKSVTTGGETAPAELVERFARRHGAELVNRYGPTETTISVTAWRCRPGERGLPPIGRPVAAAKLYVLDRGLRPVPPGVAGEICIGGVPVARGYLGRPDLTAAVFYPDPHAGAPGGARDRSGGARLYRTGDLGRFRADGVLEFLGRIDRQVKVRGFRVELGEIESALLRHPAVREAAVVDRADGATRGLVAFVTAAGDPSALAAAGLREALGRSLPAWMVPAAFVPLPALPLSPTGKVDRRALAQLAAVARNAGEAETGAPEEPLSEIEELIAGLWQELLGAEPGRRVRPGDDFFALGGHSLLATQLVSRLRATFGVELPLRAVFEAPTLAEMAGAVAAVLQTQSAAGAGVPPLVPRARADAGLPLSFAQERLWFIQRLAPASPWYNMATGLRLEGALDVPALALAFAGVVRRHESLRTTFRTAGGRPRQVIAPALELPLPLVDLTALSVLGDTARAAELRRLARGEARRPFDLERGPLVRTLLARLGPRDHALLLTLHHLVSDGWSMGVLSRELTVLYRAAATGEAGPALAPLPLQYADFALWQRELLTGANLAAHLDYWRRQLAGAPTVLELPGDRPRPAVETLRGGAARFGLSAAGTAGVRALSQRLRTTVSMTVLAAWDLLLSRWTGQEDLLVGSAVANRTRREIEDLIGFFVNILVLRGRLDGDPSFAELAGRVREASLGAYAHQDLPFERLVEELQVERDLRRNPLCQVMVGFQNFPVHRREVAGLTFHPLEQGATETGTAKADLILFAMEEEGRLAGALEYNADLFDGATAARLAAQLEHLLAAAAAAPETPIRSLPLLGAGARHQLLREWNDRPPAEPRAWTEVPLHRLFERWASEAPSAPALVEASAEVWSYGELDRRANRLAHRLLRRVPGAGPEMRVAVCLERSAAGVAAWLAVLKVGGAFVPLDPEAPADRLAWVLRDAGCAALLTRGELLASLRAAGLPAHALPAVVVDVEDDGDASLPDAKPAAADRVETGHLAYVIYTSGSTGRPKGVLVTHRGLGNLGAVLAELCALDRDGRMLQVASPVFDAAVGEVAATGWAGAALHFAPRGTPLFGTALGDLLAERAITAAHITPSALATVPPAPLPALRALLIVGEACPLELARRWAVPGRRLVNGYGPTEGTVGATGEVWDGGDRLPIGRPLPGVTVHLLDRYRAAVPPLVPGEIWLGGVGLARGYLGRPDLTAERFVPDPFAGTLGARGSDQNGELGARQFDRNGGLGARLYRTGDLARRLPDGRLEFLGRVDHQVKLRGIRIELGEIEAALAEHPAVAAAAARVYEVPAGTGDRRLGVWAAAAPELLDGSAGVARAVAAEQLAAWRELADRTHGPEPAADETFDTAGWTSSFTGEPLPAVEMREWVDHTLAELLALSPARVLEIGCGTGLLLQRVAPSTELYLGTDLAAAPLAALDRRLAGRLPQVRLEQRPADDFAGLPERGFDLVVLNSVVQYFPSAAYLEDVLSRAVDTVADGGALFVGDVRSLALLGAFHTAVELHRAAPALPAEALRRQVEARRLHEKELVLAPGFFLALAERLPRITRVEVRPKAGRARNELLLFRYQVVLHVGEAGPEPLHRQPFQWRDWSAWSPEQGGEGGPLQPLRGALAERPELLALYGIPNARASAAVAAERLLAAGEVRTVRDLRARADAAAAEAGGIDPEELRELGAELGYRVELGWSRPGSAGTFEAVFARPERAAAGLPGLHPPGARRPGTRTANTPLLGRLAERLVPELRRHLAERLPEPLVPAHLALLEALPLTATGKVDRGALPVPDDVLAYPRPTPAQAPRTAIEQVLAETWAEVLGLTSVGVEDNFFALGGHSLLATQLLSRVTAIFRVDLPLRRLFETPTVAALAAEIAARETTPGQSERLAKVLLKVKSRAESGAPVVG